MDSVKTAAFAVLLASPAFAQLTAPNCPALTSADFQNTELFNKTGSAGAVADASLSEPTRMDVEVVNKNGAYSHSNIYFVERLGGVKMYDGATKKVVSMGKINVWGKDDNGLMGIALDPGFATNRLLYLWYSPNQLVGQNRKLRLTRVAVKSDNTLDMPTEKVLIEILASKTDQWHSGGPMTFDAHGDLWIAIGNNSPDLAPNPTTGHGGNCNVMSTTDSTNSSEWGSSSTANMRGGFIRIHPDNSAKGYSIPRGNFGEYWADKFESQGKTALAEQYRDPKKVLPEIYVKGERSNYSISVHPTKRWLAWGTVNFATTFDEFNITKTPIFSGFPYFHANNAKTCTGHTISADAPVNNSPFNSGVKELPPAVPGTINNLVNVAIGGPLYAFDSSLASAVKFPPHFDNTWILAGFAGGMWVAKLDTATLKVSGTPLKVDGNLLPRARNHVQSMYGKDGALYILNYDGYYNSAINPGVMRVTYKGTCNPVSVARDDRRPSRADAYQNIRLTSTTLVVGEKGPHTFTLHAVDGTLVHRAEGMDRAEYSLTGLRTGMGLEKGVYLVRVNTAQGLYSRSVSLF